MGRNSSGITVPARLIHQMQQNLTQVKYRILNGNVANNDGAGLSREVNTGDLMQVLSGISKPVVEGLLQKIFDSVVVLFSIFVKHNRTFSQNVGSLHRDTNTPPR